MGKTVLAIEYQTNAIQNEIPILQNKKNIYDEKSNYQMEMYNSVKFLNQAFLVCYVILFTVIHVLLLVQYLQGVKRDEIADTVWITILFWYPYLIYYLERTIYFCITYFLSLIYGKMYVYQFDQLLLFTDFYADPGMNKQTSVLTA
jgi:hypothetical protein